MSNIAIVDRSAGSAERAEVSNAKGRTEEPADPLQKAVAAHLRGELDEAERLYRAVLKQQPRNAVALNDLGIVMVQRGQRALGEDLFRNAVSAKSDYVEAYANLGTLLRERGELDEAIAQFQRALAAKPRYADAHFHLGKLFEKKDNADEAIACFKRAIACNPDHADAHFLLGILLEKKGSLDAAIASFERAAASRPDDAGAHFCRGYALKTKGNIDEAIIAYRAAIANKPNWALPHVVLGCALGDKGELDNAAAAYQRALQIAPNDAITHSNLAFTLISKGEVDAAIQRYRHAIAIDPNASHAHFGLSLALLQKGDFREGWNEYEWRWRGAIEQVKPREMPRPQWQGEDLSGKTLLLHCEQGLGDTIQFVRLIPWLRARGAKVILEAPVPLVSLLRMACIADLVVPAGTKVLPNFHFHLPLLSVPVMMRLQEAGIPAEVPYLAPDPLAVERWRAELAGTLKLKVGIAWAGSPRHRGDRKRSMALEQLQPLLQLPGIRWFSLQVGDRAADLASLPAGTVTDLSPRLTDFADTASVLASLDLVLTVDTSVGHLAGALGRPTWIMVPFAADWRWLRDREDSPWYPTVRLFRQQQRGNWNELLERVAAELRAVTSGDHGSLFPVNSVQAVADPGARANAFFDQGLQLQRDSRLDEAAAAYRKAIAIEPNHPHAYGNLGVIVHGSGRLDEAIALYQRAIAIEPQHAAAHGNLAIALSAQGKPVETITAGRGAIAAKTDAAGGHGNVGDALKKSTVERSVTAVKECRHGQMLYLKGDKYVGKSLDAYGEFSELEVKIFSQFLKKGDVVAEVGANIGAHTIAIAKLVGQTGQVLAFEPQRVIFQILCANLALNGLFNVRTYQAAVGRETGMITVPQINYTTEANFGGLSLGKWDAGENVQVLKLDALNLPALRLLKVDVEGMEAEVLSGAKQTIAKYRPILYVENDRRAHSEQLIELLNAFGYRMWWHLPKLFNPKNFANNKSNLFGEIISINLLCCPKEVPAEVTGLRAVTGPADWWQEPLCSNSGTLPAVRPTTEEKI
jgi:FkbM family methyltransferase